jgi:IS30 family transposase
MHTTERELVVYDTLFEPEFTRSEIAQQLNISVMTVQRYIKYGAKFIPELSKYVSGDSLNMSRFHSSDLVFLEEIADLKRRFSPERVEAILTRKYSQEV